MPNLNASPSISLPRPSRGLNIALWSVQLLLAAVFTMAGLMKSTMPIAELAQKFPWTAVVPHALTRFIGVSEFAAAMGLALPSLTRIKPGLTPLAAAGLVLVMVLAAGFHLMRGEFQALPINFVIGCMATFVAWGRFRKAPISPRE